MLAVPLKLCTENPSYAILRIYRLQAVTVREVIVGFTSGIRESVGGRLTWEAVAFYLPLTQQRNLARHRLVAFNLRNTPTARQMMHSDEDK